MFYNHNFQSLFTYQYAIIFIVQNFQFEKHKARKYLLFLLKTKSFALAEWCSKFDGIHYAFSFNSVFVVVSCFYMEIKIQFIFTATFFLYFICSKWSQSDEITSKKDFNSQAARAILKNERLARKSRRCVLHKKSISEMNLLWQKLDLITQHSMQHRLGWERNRRSAVGWNIRWIFFSSLAASLSNRGKIY